MQQTLTTHEDDGSGEMVMNPPTQMEMTREMVIAQTRKIQEIMEAVMIKDVHYGVIPGCGKKPSLLKPGAEKIASTFRMAIDPQVEDLSTNDCMRFRVRAVATHMATGLYLGTGIGECSSNETKYKWRAGKGKEWDETPEDRRRIKYEYDKTVKQVRTEPADEANTVLKMAKKRALVDCVLTVTAASDIFAQDLEDLQSPGDSDDGKPPVKQPARKSKKKEEPKTDGPRVITEKQRKRLLAICNRTQVDKSRLDAALLKMNIDSTTKIPMSIYEKVCDWAENGGVNPNKTDA